MSSLFSDTASNGHHNYENHHSSTNSSNDGHRFTLEWASILQDEWDESQTPCPHNNLKQNVVFKGVQRLVKLNDDVWTNKKGNTYQIKQTSKKISIQGDHEIYASKTQPSSIKNLLSQCCCQVHQRENSTRKNFDICAEFTSHKHCVILLGKTLS